MYPGLFAALRGTRTASMKTPPLLCCMFSGLLLAYQVTVTQRLRSRDVAVTLAC
jgi:hypothetical protein